MSAIPVQNVQLTLSTIGATRSSPLVFAPFLAELGSRCGIGCEAGKITTFESQLGVVSSRTSPRPERPAATTSARSPQPPGGRPVEHPVVTTTTSADEDDADKIAADKIAAERATADETPPESDAVQGDSVLPVGTTGGNGEVELDVELDETVSPDADGEVTAEEGDPLGLAAELHLRRITRQARQVATSSTSETPGDAASTSADLGAELPIEGSRSGSGAEAGSELIPAANATLELAPSLEGRGDRSIQSVGMPGDQSLTAPGTSGAVDVSLATGSEDATLSGDGNTTPARAFKSREPRGTMQPRPKDAGLPTAGEDAKRVADVIPAAVSSGTEPAGLGGNGPLAATTAVATNVSLVTTTAAKTEPRPILSHATGQFLGRPAVTSGDETVSRPELDQGRFVERVARAMQLAESRNSPLRIRLHPPELGAIRLEVQVRAGALHARVEAESGVTKAILMDQLPLLRERLAEQGVRLEQFDVNVPDRQERRDASGFEQPGERQRETRPERQAAGREAPREAERNGAVVRHTFAADAGKLDVTI